MQVVEGYQCTARLGQGCGCGCGCIANGGRCAGAALGGLIDRRRGRRCPASNTGIRMLVTFNKCVRGAGAGCGWMDANADV
jgi:hypothetical protein